MNPNIDCTTARPDDTAFNIEGNQPSTQHEVNIPREPASPMDDDSMLSEEDYAARIASQNNMDENVVHFSPPQTFHHLTLHCPPPKLHVPPMRRTLVLPQQLIQSHQRNLPLPRSSLTAPMSLPILLCGMVISRLHPYSAQTSS